MKKLIISLLLGVIFAHSAHAGFSVGMTGAVLKQAKKLDEKVRKHRRTDGWVLVPGNPAFGTSDFYVMAFEAKRVNFVATSHAEDLPWINVSHKTAVAACAALGGGAHLVTLAEAQTINRNIEAQPANWVDGVVGSLVSAGGGLKRGNSGSNDTASYSTNGLQFGTGREMAKLVLSNGSELWDWSGNVCEWLYGDGQGGTLGTPNGVIFDNIGIIQWDNATLAQERAILGPSNSSWNAANGLGTYYIQAPTPEQLVCRGGSYTPNFSGVFGLTSEAVDDTTGFRCAR